jgi:hypothetical protein
VDNCRSVRQRKSKYTSDTGNEKIIYVYSNGLHIFSKLDLDDFDP